MLDVSRPVKRVGPRAYDVSGRQAQALERRRSVRAAAKELFLRQGFAATSMAAIAGSAGVSVALVHAQFGTKVALLKEVYDVTLAGDDEPVAIPQRPQAVRWRHESDPAVILREYAHAVRERHERLADLRRVIDEAALVDEGARALAADNDRQRLQGMTMLAGLLAATGGLAPDVDEARTADVLWVMNSAAVYDLCVRRRGWSLDEFEAWLARSYIRLLLA